MIYRVTIRNISARTDCMKLPQGKTVCIEIKAADSVDAIQKVVKKIFGNEAIFTHKIGCGQVAFIDESGLNLYGRIHADCVAVS